MGFWKGFREKVVGDVYKRQAANKEKADAQVALSYTLGDAYTMDYWVDIAKRIEDMGATSILSLIHI